ncbi:hypothetical protein IWQ62_001995 [Dispira parvispora]|uniref:Uncharacterized protein n=1 Tax=Dispira parvispora TaxID=1520584 RepID=A0A9W8AWM5_9FUNG|nr:hypothetical protein IWQ62_001995 [Dispira parvispora]
MAAPPQNSNRRPRTAILTTSPRSPFPKFRYNPLAKPDSNSVRQLTRRLTTKNHHRRSPSLDSNTDDNSTTSAGAQSSGASDTLAVASSAPSPTSNAVSNDLSSVSSRRSLPVVLPSDVMRQSDGVYLELANGYDQSSTLIPLRSDGFIWNHELFVTPYSPYYKLWTRFYHVDGQDSDDESATDSDRNTVDDPDESSFDESHTHTEVENGDDSGCQSSQDQEQAISGALNIPNNYANWVVTWSAGNEDVQVHEIRVD